MLDPLKIFNALSNVSRCVLNPLVSSTHGCHLPCLQPGSKLTLAVNTTPTATSFTFVSHMMVEILYVR
jgi:hypothetical protein